MPFNDNRKPLMLWSDDFKTEKDWEAVCKVLSLPNNIKEIELKVEIIAAFPYKHRFSGVAKVSDDSQCNPELCEFSFDSESAKRIDEVIKKYPVCLKDCADILEAILPFVEMWTPKGLIHKVKILHENAAL